MDLKERKRKEACRSCVGCSGKALNEWGMHVNVKVERGGFLVGLDCNCKVESTQSKCTISPGTLSIKQQEMVLLSNKNQTNPWFLVLILVVGITRSSLRTICLFG